MSRPIQTLTATVLLLAAACAAAQENPLFDPELSQWDGAKGYWEYKEGVFIAAAPEGVKRATKKANSSATNLISKKSHSDFELAYKVRVGRKSLLGTPGVYIRSSVSDAANHLVTGPSVHWDTGNLVFKGVKRVPKTPGLIDSRDFNDFKITCIGKHITISVNGQKVIDDTFAVLPASGVIAWQLFGHTPSEYMVRDIRFRDLSKNAKPPVAPLINEPAKPAPERCSRETMDVFAAISGPCWLNDQRAPAGDIKAAFRLSTSQDPKVRDIAKKALDMRVLQELRTEQGRKTLAALQLQVEVGAPLNFAKRIAKGETNPSMSQIIEDLMGSKVQDEFNKAYLLTYMGMDQSAKLRRLVQSVAQANPPADLGVKTPIAVYCETTPETLGSLTFRNDSGRTLHHVLVVGRLAVDAEAAKAAGASEDAIGRDLLPGIGFSKETVEGSRLAGQLRALAAQIDPGTVVYIPEVKPGATVRLRVTPSRSLVRARSADLSVYCDELTLVSQRPGNFFEAQVTAKYPPHKKAAPK